MNTLSRLLRFNFVLTIALVVLVFGLIPSSSLFAVPSDEKFQMPNHSMAPTIKMGDTVSVDMRAYSTDNPQVGELAVFRPNEKKGLKWIFRVAAVPGDIISYEKGVLRRNGFPIYAPGPNRDQTFTIPKNMKEGTEIDYPYRLGESEYFFLSDDPSHMHDSRYWGLVERSNILGKVTSHE